MNSSDPILIYGGNELASAIALKLFNCQLKPAIYVYPDEIFLRHNLCFGDAVYQNRKTIEGVSGETVSEESVDSGEGNSYPEKLRNAVQFLLKDRKIPILHQLSDIDAPSILNPSIIINSLPPNVIADQMTPASGDAAMPSVPVIGCYPHHVPGQDCHWAVETRLNYRLGQIYEQDIENAAPEKIDLHFFKSPFEYCTMPLEGVWIALKQIGETAKYNEALGKIDEVEIRSPYDGQVWGIAHSGKIYPPKAAIAQIYTAPKTEDYRYFGFRENAIAGGVLEAVLRILD